MIHSDNGYIPSNSEPEAAQAIGSSETPTSQPILREVPLHAIIAGRNPRTLPSPSVPSGSDSTTLLSDAARDLEGLARSLGDKDDPRLAEPPLVEKLSNGTYRLYAGERRVEAARIAGWDSILCLVYTQLDPVRGYMLGMVENLHRVPMHPLDEAAALRTSLLLANADARDLGAEARSIMAEAWDQQESQHVIIEKLRNLLIENGWNEKKPEVTWASHLDGLGLDMVPWERKRKLRLLNLDPSLHDRLRALPLTEAALRAMGTLPLDLQARCVSALERGELLPRQVRRLARTLTTHIYTSFDEAMLELRGFAPRPGSPNSLNGDTIDRTSDREDVFGEDNDEDDALAMPGQPTLEQQDYVVQLLDVGEQIRKCLTGLADVRGGAELLAPWGSWAREQLVDLRDRLIALRLDQ